MSHSWHALFFVSVMSLSTLVLSQASAYDNPTSSPNIPFNYGTVDYHHSPNLPYYYSKEKGQDLEINATVYNPINLYGNVTDPTGVVHQMSTISSEKGMVELRYYAPVSDPDGTYVARFELIPGPSTSNLSVTGETKNYPTPTTHPVLSIPIAPLQQLARGFDVTCYHDLILIKKVSNNSPACVKLATAQKLVKRGWGVIVTNHTPNLTPVQACNGDTLIPYSYALPCIRPTPMCPSNMTYSNGMCTTTPPFIQTPPTKPDCIPSSNTTCSVSSGVAYPSCSGAFSENICQPDSTSCPTGLQGDPYGTACNYNTSKCPSGYVVIQISAGSFSCQPSSPPSLSNATSYSAGQKVGVFTISKINKYNVTGYYNNPYPIVRPGLGYFIIMHIGDTLNPTCDGSAPLVITAINYPNSITVSVGKRIANPYGCPICLSADSEIKTPNGEVNVKDIKDGMTVWSTDSNGTIIKSKVIKINKVFVGDAQKIVDLQLVDGRELFVSPSHPTYDGRTMADLKIGERYDNSTVKSMELVQYKYQFTYDILPDSQTGNYFANGILVGSTLK